MEIKYFDTVSHRRGLFPLCRWRGPAIVVVIALLAGSGFAEDTTFVIVRHAEKDKSFSGSDKDMPLTCDGEKRALALAKISAAIGVKHVFFTEYLRSKNTALPTVKSLGLKTNPPYNKFPSQIWIDKLKQRHRGSTVLIVVHSNSIRDVVKKLCKYKISPISESEYDLIYIVRLKDGLDPLVADLRFGTVEKCE